MQVLYEKKGCNVAQALKAWYATAQHVATLMELHLRKRDRLQLLVKYKNHIASFGGLARHSKPHRGRGRSKHGNGLRHANATSFGSGCRWILATDRYLRVVLPL